MMDSIIRWKRFMLCVIGISLIIGANLFAKPALDLSTLLNQGYAYLDNWQFEDAGEIGALVQEKVGQEFDPVLRAQAYLFLAQYWFHLGDYKRAIEDAEKSIELNPKSDSKVRKFLERLKFLANLFENAKEITSEHFRFRYTDPRDEVLAKPGLLALEQAYQALSRDFNFVPQGEKILVEIYPRPSDLAMAVGLEEKMIKDSGTIAICKYRRMMVTSPRALLFGYDYQTTFSHELVHFFIYSLAGEAVPVWLHEGLAKYEEMSYKGRAGELDPVPKSLLVSALRNKELITFAQMSPTFAQFKTPKQGQLAFAEVSTMVDYIRQNCGQDSWFKMINMLKQGKTDKEAMRAVCGKDFSAIWSDWQRWVLAKGWKELPGAVVMKLEFKEQEGEEEKEEIVGTEDGKAWEFVRLGDLLRDRQYYPACVIEYKKAQEIEPYDPKILNKLGLAQTLAQDYASAISTLKKSAEIYPDYSTTYVYLGNAYVAMGADKEAIQAFETALSLNPFNPTPYRSLINLYQRSGDVAKAKEMQAGLNIIRKTGR